MYCAKSDTIKIVSLISEVIFPLTLFKDISKLPNIELISLHKGEGENQIKDINFELTTLGDDFDAGENAFEDTAAIMMNCDLIITGEGKLDSQTRYGKVISGICSLAKKYKKPIIAVCGDSDIGIKTSLGIKKVYNILDNSYSIDSAIKNAEYYLSKIGKKIADNI